LIVGVPVSVHREHDLEARRSLVAQLHVRRVHGKGAFEFHLSLHYWEFLETVETQIITRFEREKGMGSNLEIFFDTVRPASGLYDEVIGSGKLCVSYGMDYT
jgi:hypothetical protein